MARTVNAAEYAKRRSAILDASYRLVVEKGYQQMTIHDVIDALGTSKGAFYHYFDSKPALLAAMIDRSISQWEAALVPIADDDGPSLERLQRFFTVLAQAKTGDREFLMSALRVLYSDDNAVVVQKSRAAGMQRFAPLLSRIIRDGVEHGVFSASHPDQLGEVLVALVQDLVESAGRLMLDDEGDLELLFAAYTETIARALGIPAGSLELVDEQTMREWLAAAPRKAGTR